MTNIERLTRPAKYNIRAFVDAGGDINAVYEGGITQLMDAISIGALDIVKCLVEAGADVNFANERGRTALIDAAMWGHLDIAKYLIEKGAKE
jgi:uncharacterized protein